MMADDSLTDLRFRISNAKRKQITLILEPWGDQYELKPGQMARISARCLVADCMEVELTEGGVTIWGGEKSIVQVLETGA